MRAKDRLKQLLSDAALQRQSGQLEKARQILQSVAEDPEANALGLLTACGLPRGLQSAYLKQAKAEKNAIEKAGYRFHLTPPPELLLPFCRFSTNEKIAINEANKQAVPRSIHQIWVGSRSLPQGAEAWRDHAAEHGYEYTLWRESDLETFGIHKNPAYREMYDKGDLPGAVDVARYIILDKLGGIYLDCDWYPARQDISFHDLMPMTGMGGMAEDIPRNTGKGGLLMANSLIMTPPSHPVLAKLLQTLPDALRILPDAPAWWVTGPLLFTLMSRGGSLSLADSDIVAGELPQETSTDDVIAWCQRSQHHDGGLLLSWKSWIW